ncbi:TPA: HlyD family efflux transporter periplasmic adaptor subunit [Aeromonas hydrophila]|uniref:HlyD family secretion protein n=1 Tax=Aeromonas hydrophila TaxID=644 RepID=UPI0028D97A71|nr:HlyD family efflux transporter periplasmic adaptor subunit [Aeromonas hydrophila]
MSKRNESNLIFRTEALQYKREGWFGPSRLHIPSSVSICIFTGFITSSLIVLLIAFGSYSERINVTGTVVFDPPAVLLIAHSDGTIKSSSALEGKEFHKNELIFSLSSDTRTNSGDINAEMVKLLKEQRNALSKRMDIVVSDVEETRNYLAKKIENKENEIDGVRRLIKSSEEQNAWLGKKSNQYMNFRGKGIALDSESIERTKDYYLAIESLSSAKVKNIALMGELLDLTRQESSIDNKLAEKKESFSIEISNINQKILDAEKNKESLIIAPFDGTITSVTAHVGERVTAGQPIAVLVPHGAVPKVELLSPSDFLGEVSNGLQVKMRVAAYPYQWYGKVTGVIETISTAPINTSSQVRSKGDNSERGFFRIMVRPELTEQQINMSLLPGMEVETEIFVKTRKLYEWLFIPFVKVYERATDGIK